MEKNKKYILLFFTLCILFFFLWNKGYYFNLNPYKGEKYKVVLHCEGRPIPIMQNKISYQELMAWDSITLRNEFEQVHQIQEWEVVVVETQTSHFKAVMESNEVPSNVFEEIRKMKKPGAIFLQAHKWASNQHRPNCESRRVDIIY